MSHFLVLVIGDEPEKQLAPFDENLETPRYVKYTRSQLIAKGKKEIEEYKNGLYAEYLLNPLKYEMKCSNDRHFRYISEEFPEKLNWTDDQIYQYELRWYEPEEIGIEGGIYSERNPNSKWDWYELGGRYAGRLVIKDGVDLSQPNFSWGWPEIEKEKVLSQRRTDQAFVKDIENLSEISCFAVLKDGKWHERGEMGWWGMVSNEKDSDEWNKQVKLLLESLSYNTLISIYDCHI